MLDKLKQRMETMRSGDNFAAGQKMTRKKEVQQYGSDPSQLAKAKGFVAVQAKGQDLTKEVAKQENRSEGFVAVQQANEKNLTKEVIKQEKEVTRRIEYPARRGARRT
eukprot:1127602-Prorocentrum_minimum.AAC.1